MTVWKVDPSIPESWDERWLEFKEHGSLSFESIHLKKSGDVIPVEVTTNYIEHEGKAYLVAFSRDLTERKKQEKLLEDEASRRRLLVEQSRDGIVVLDQAGKVCEANEAYARMLGYSMEEVYQLHVWDWESQFSKEQTLEMLSTVDEEGDHFETRHRRKDGTLRDVEISTNGAVYGGQRFIFCVCRDITERKQAEEALRQSEERLRESQKMEAVGQLAGGIAHDFNNLLTAILGYSEMILASKASSLDEVRPDIEEIKHAGERASVLTQQILAFSRRQILRPAALSLNEVLEGMESLLTPHFG